MIVDRLNTDLKTAMLSGDKRLAGILRNLKSAILYEQVAQGSRGQDITDEMTTKVLLKEQKKRIDAIALYDQAGDTERSNNETYENEIISSYLPKPASDEDVAQAIENYVAENSVDMSSPKAMGMIIGGVKSSISGTVDGALLAQKVKKYIAESNK